MNLFLIKKKKRKTAITELSLEKIIVIFPLSLLALFVSVFSFLLSYYPCKMGRMYGKGKGISASAIPYRRKPPTWLKQKPSEIEETIIKLAKKGQTPSQIGSTLRDNYGIPRVTPVTGTKILRILRAHGVATTIPEDLYFLIKKAVSMRKHLEQNKKDTDCKFRLILTESKIHRIARYYKRKRLLPPNWKYQASTASALIA